MSAHTPGPWTWVKNKHANCWALEDQRGIAIVDDGSAGDEYGRTIDPEGGEEDRANARLIASAPRLLHALKKCMAQLEILLPSSGVTHDERQAIIDGNNAIAEAEGKQ